MMKNTVKVKKRSLIKLYSLILFILILIVSVGAGLQTLAEYIFKLRVRPSGELVNLDGYYLNIHCSGTGNPTIILESDLAYPSLQWALVQRELSQLTRVCSYDRAGLGWSGVSPIPRKGQDMAEELYRLLHKNHVESPLIMVGYNRGTWLTRLYAYLYPDDVTGIVLIAPYPEEINQGIPQAYRVNRYWTEAYDTAMIPTTWLGITRLSVLLGGMEWFTEPFSNISQDIRYQILETTILRSTYWKNSKLEMSLEKGIAAEFKGKKQLGNLPLWILNSYTVHLNVSDKNYSGEIKAVYEKFQSEIAQISTNSLEVNCVSCGSMPPITDVEQVVSVVQQALTVIKTIK